MKVKIELDCGISADTIEEAISKAQAGIDKLRATLAERNTPNGYHHWNKMNDGDVNWYPHNERDGDGNYSHIHIINLI